MGAEANEIMEYHLSSPGTGLRHQCTMKELRYHSKNNPSPTGNMAGIKRVQIIDKKISTHTNLVIRLKIWKLDTQNHIVGMTMVILGFSHLENFGIH